MTLFLLPDDATAAEIEVPQDEITIMRAISAAKDGDTVVVYNGDYDENIIIGKRITLKGTDQRTVVLRNTNGASVITVTSPQVTISNLRIEGSKARVGIYAHDVTGLSVRKVSFTGCEKGMMLEMGYHLTVENCTFRNGHTSGLYVAGSYDERCENIDIRDCTFADNKASAILLNRCRHVRMDRLSITGSGNDGINAHKVAWAHLRNSTVSDNGNGLMLFDSHGWDIEDNIIQNNRQNGIELNQSGAEIPNELHRNQISRNSRGQGTSAAGILFFGKGAADNIVADNDIAENPTGLNFISYSGGCNYNTFRRNVVRKCDYGIWESMGTGPNTYHMNDFLYNSIQAAAVNQMSTFDDGHLGNYWSDYQTKVPSAIKMGPLWSAPYQVVSGVATYDEYPLAYRYEQDPPIIQHLGPLDGEVLTPGRSATFGVMASDASHIEGYTWKVKTPDGFESSYELASTKFTYTFSKVGFHWITVVVTDVWGVSATVSNQYYLEDSVPPVADAGPDITVGLGRTFTLDGTGSSDGHGIATISWVLDPDGLNLRFHSSVVEFAISELGVFPAIVFVVDFSGNSASDTMNVWVKDLTPPVAVARGDTAVSLGDKVTFDGSLSNDNVGVVKWQWTIRDRSLIAVVNEPVFEYTFNELGRFKLTLTVQDGAGQKATAELEVVVRDTEPPVARVGGDQQVLMGTLVTMDAYASTDNVAITRYEWKFFYGGDNQFLYGRVVSWQFDLPGEYLVILVVYDGANNHDTDSLVVTVVDTEPPEAGFWAPESIELGETITLDASASTDNLGVRTYEWRIVRKDRTDVLRGMTVNVPMERPGTYKVTLTVRDAAGNEDSEEMTLYVPPKDTGTDAPFGLLAGMVTVLAAAVLLGYLYARRRYGDEE